MEDFYNFLEDHLDPNVAKALLEKAEAMDQAQGLTDEAVEAKHKAVKDWRRRVAKVNAWMQRTIDNPPTDYDLKKLEMVEHYFKK